MRDLFSDLIEPSDKNYSVMRDNPRFLPLREYCDQLWEKFHDFADPEFPQQFACNLHPRFWELYLGATLLDQGFNLIPKRSSAGPDFHFILDGRQVWIEAAAPGEGIGPDAVPLLEGHRGYDPVPEDKIILRFTHSISKKKTSFLDYLNEGLVGEDDALLIAINGRGIEMLIFEGPLPSIIKSVYPIGPYTVTIDVESMEVMKEGYQTRFEIQKQSGSMVSTSAFLDHDYSMVSGVLYSNTALWDLPQEPGQELIFIHNSVARVNMDIGWLGIGREYYKEGNHLTGVDN